MYVCMYVMYVCMYVCMCVCIYVRMYVCMYVCRYIYIYIYIYLHTYIFDLCRPVPVLLCPSCHLQLIPVPSTCYKSRHRESAVHLGYPTVESRIGPKRDFGSTPDELSTISKPNPYPKSDNPPAQKWFSKPNLLNPLGRFDGESAVHLRYPTCRIGIHVFLGIPLSEPCIRQERVPIQRYCIQKTSYI